MGGGRPGGDGGGSAWGWQFPALIYARDEKIGRGRGE